MADNAAPHEQHMDSTHIEMRVRALESILTEKGYVNPAVLDQIVETYENKIGPHLGARIVARAWLDEDFKADLLRDANIALGQMDAEWLSQVQEGFSPAYQLTVLQNTPSIHNMVVCTLCSCYPWNILGLPPTWYKSAAYRSRTVKDPRAVLSEFGVHLGDDVVVQVWDSTASQRYLVLPMRPPGTEGWSMSELASIVSRNSMIGTAIPRSGLD